MGPHRPRGILEVLLAKIDKFRVDPAADVFVSGA
jgi:hypothetical protein